MMVIMYTEARDSEAKTGEPFVTEQYLEDFRAGQTFRAGRSSRSEPPRLGPTKE